ncbi:Arm DNA-binding domain-containing protein [Ekhidna sp.]|uniref:Arm DNA-binding domain-containing protein n=1 Tax=Ekhidna sp. TaxID=2608089 RepID=UPI0032977B0E
MDKNGLIPVYMLLTFNGQRIRKSLKNFKLKKRDWNAKKGRVRPSKDEFKLHESLNSKLESIEETVHKINKTVLKFDIHLSEEYILSRIENPECIEISSRDFFSVTEEYLRSVKGVKADRTITGSRTAFNFLKDYQKEKKIKISFESLNSSGCLQQLFPSQLL